MSSVEVEPGYKMTEAGVIPEDWKIVDYTHLGAIIDGDRGINYPNASELMNYGDCLFLDASNVTKDGFRFVDCRFISADKDKKLNKGKLNKFDVVLTTRGTIGNFAYFDEKVPFTNIRINSGMVILRNSLSIVTNIYHYLILRSSVIASQINRISFGSAQPQLTVKGIGGLKIPFPPSMSEQRSIATILCDVNLMIESLEQLIAKKRKIKQGVMQILLSPFENGNLKAGWSKLEFFEIVGKYIDYRGRTPKKLGMNWGGGNILVLSANNVQMGKIDVEKEAYYASDELYKKWMIQGECCKGDVLLTMEAPLGNVAQIPDGNKYILSQRVLLIRPNNKVIADFLMHYMKGINFQKELLKNASGSTAQGIQRKKLDMLPIFFPEDIDKQSQIATILSDMDCALTVLYKKLAKLKQIKQCLMHNLLTGKIRLV